MAHGRETTATRRERSLASARLAVLESAGHTLGLMGGTRTRGPKPAGLAEAFPELQEAVRRILIRKLGKDGN
jgi:hypothetical protein